MTEVNKEVEVKKEETTFADLGLSPEILAAVEAKGYKNPSPIQAGVIPLLLNGEKDIVGQAQTGTGKTAAFGLPLLSRIDASSRDVKGIILCPTRELAIQVANEIKSFSPKNSLTIQLLYGGQPIREEMSGL
ncbi:MAG: DEAD/DEAH box helicase, partial [Patescibacteria group bacterium]|nr:DEAD/DEAH box helicase [Patescibacteria group bacterium]